MTSIPPPDYSYPSHVHAAAFRPESTSVEVYFNQQVAAVNDFLASKSFSIFETITDRELESATPLSTGVSGAQKITLSGEEYILKCQVFPEVFNQNFSRLVASGNPLDHRQISESDDSFAFFPIKEVTGYHLAKLFGLDVPETKLVRLPDGKIASIQKFLPDAKSMMAEVAGKRSETNLYEIETHSVLKCCLFQVITENIDGHSGNILLKSIPEIETDDDDDLAPSFEALPIDYGLLFPRHDSIYPKEVSLVKKGLLDLAKSKTLDVKKLIESMPKIEAIVAHPILNQLMLDSDKTNLIRNLSAMFAVGEKLDGKIQLDELLKNFIEERIALGRK